MTLKIPINAALIFTVVMLSIFSCSKERKIAKCTDPTNPKCGNYDPCFEKRITADFDICEFHYESGTNYKDSFLYPTDTAIRSELVAFRLKSKFYDSVKFYLGAEEIKSNYFKRKFFPPGVHIPVTCVVYFSSFKDCNPNDNGIDTVKKSFFSMSWAEPDVPIAGEWKGHNEDEPNIEFSITVYDTMDQFFSPPLPWHEWKLLSLYGLPRGNTSPKYQNDEISKGVRSFFASVATSQTNYAAKQTGYFIGSIRGYCEKGIIHIEHEYDENGYLNYLDGGNRQGIKLVTKKFIGKKTRKI